MTRCVNSIEHYDLLIEEQCDPCRDSDILKEYMSRWDGPRFYDFLCLSSEKTVLEIGIGTGRIAQKLLNRQIGLNMEIERLSYTIKNHNTILKL